MRTNLAEHINSIRLCDTHEHLCTEQAWVEDAGDILVDLWSGYPRADLVVAGASEDDVKALLDPSNPDIEGRFRAVERAWRAARFTGYSEAVRIQAKVLYGLEEITAEGLARAQSKLAELRRPGERLRLLRDVAHLDHVQVDDFRWVCAPDPSGVDFFFYDINWASFCMGHLGLRDIFRETGIDVKDIDSLDEAMAAVFAKYAPFAVAVKANHAYGRTLEWRQRTKDEAAAALARVLTSKSPATEDRLCLGDWCWARGLEHAAAYGLPFKIHTGYYAGYGSMYMERINPSHLSPLAREYKKTRFVLMHIGYPYHQELLALAKHYPNVWVDLCWAWSIDPQTSSAFVRQFLRAAPINKLLVFGGDAFRPTQSVAYAIQTRRWLTRTLQAEVDSGELTEAEAQEIASRLMRENQYELFDLEGLRIRLRSALGERV